MPTRPPSGLPRATRRLLALLGAACALAARAQPAAPDTLALSDVRAGQRGEVWTVFQGTKPEPFTVEVTGVVRNAVGPGKSLILCRLTDPRVQNMGAVAGMSGSPLYIDGKFAGALSYQVQEFETVRYAGFTPAADMDEVAQQVGAPAPPDASQAPAQASAPEAAFQSMRPVFALGGVSPRTAEVMAPQFDSLGIGVVSIGGSSQVSPVEPSLPADAAMPGLRPGDAVSVALTTGDITIAGTGTVSRVDGNRVVAFGHPMLGLGNVRYPMCVADVVAILPSNLKSFKVANVGPVIGCISQDRLSAVSGLLGPGPEMIDVAVLSERPGAPKGREVDFQVVRDRRIAPVIMLTGVVDAVLASNDSGSSEGVSITSTVSFSPTRSITRVSLFAGRQGFLAGMVDFLAGLNAEIQNPFEDAMPASVRFRVELLPDNPLVTVEQFKVSRTTVRAGESFSVGIAWRDYQGAHREATVTVPVAPAWAGKTLEVVAAPGRVLDELTGHSRMFRPGQLRSFDAYLDALRGSRPEDGLCVSVVEKSALFFDQEVATPDVPASIQRIAESADSTRYQRREAAVSLWETRVLEGKVALSDFHSTVRVEE
jgi:hypothetical protein